MRAAYIFLLLFVSWALLFWYHYVHNIRQVCAVSTSIVEPVDSVELDVALLPTATTPLLFKPKSFEPVLEGTFQDLINTVISPANTDQKLEITGYYTSNEQSGLDYDIGLARASELKKILLDEIPEDRMEIFTDTISNFIFYEDSLVEAVSYEWVDGYEPELVNKDYYLLEHDTKVVLPEEFQALLEQIAERLKLSGETVILRGHTDTAGDDEYNFKIAHRNAKKIRDVFRTLGVNRGKIITSSQGEDEPIADNETEAGKIKNRRIEIEFKE